MTQPVTLPLWLLILILGFAVVTFASHFLFPSVRWYFRRRMERVVAKLNARLERPIQPFKLMRRHDMIMRLIHDPEVMEAVVAEAQETGEPEQVVHARARQYAREIVPSFSASVYFGFATRAARWLVRMMYRVRIGHVAQAEIEQLDPEATVIFVMNHRSNMDYILVTHLVADRSALSYAVGEWARIWPLSRLIRAMGAYFIRRKDSNTLYRRVLARYVRMATDQGVTQAMFPEGGLSLTGSLAPPKLGLFAYMMNGFQPKKRDVIFIPVAVSYDRVLEDRVLIEASRLGTRRFKARIFTVMGFVLRNLWRKLRGRFRRFGYAAVSFGTPLSLAEFLASERPDPATALANILMGRIARVTTVLPVPLVAAAWEDSASMKREDLVARVEDLVAKLMAHGAVVHLPGGVAANAASAGITSLQQRGILHLDGENLTIAPEDLPLLAFYAAIVLQAQNAPATENAAISGDAEPVTT
jgi:glycerol-3-phosphate O-acyltransferase